MTERKRSVLLYILYLGKPVEILNTEENPYSYGYGKGSDRR